MNKVRKKLFFIMNPVAGKGRSSNIVEQIEQHIDSQQFDVKFLVSSDKGEAEKLSLQAVREGADIIVAVGGDGTVNEIAKSILHTDIILGIIPVGSGNGLAHHLKIPADVDKAVDKINQLNIRKIDSGTINSLFFISVAGIGFDAVVAEGYDNSGKRGFKSYFLNSVKLYLRYRPAKYKIQFNNTLIARRAFLITFANSDQFGYHTSIAPEASIDDGLLDMCILKKVPLLQAPVVLGKLFSKKIHKSKYHESYKITEATIFRKRTSVIQIDGEPVKMDNKILHVLIHPKSIRIIV